MSASARKHHGHVPQHPTGSLLPKNVVVFGESGVGKSSLINLIAGRSIAATSSGAKGCTFHHEKYELQVDGTPYAIWDTTGLDEGTYGTVPAEIAEENLRGLLCDLTRANGIHLLMYCVRASRLRQTLLSNYNLFYSAICRKKVPVVIVVTGLENYEGEMAQWWDANETEFAMLKMHFDGHACVTTLNAERVNSPVLKQRCYASRRAVLELIANTCARDRWGTQHQEGWVPAAIADVRAMFKPPRHHTTPPTPIVALYDDLPGRSLDSITLPLPPFEGGRLIDVGGSPIRMYRIHERQLSSGARFKKQIASRGADLLIFCTSLRTADGRGADRGASKRRAAAFYGSYGGDTRPLLVVVRDAMSDEAASEWWNAPEHYDRRVSGDVRAHTPVRHLYHYPHDDRTHPDAGKLQAIVRALPPAGSTDTTARRMAITKLQRVIQTRALQPLDVAPSGCFGWLTGARRSSPPSKAHLRGAADVGFVEEDWLTKSGVWVPRRTH